MQVHNAGGHGESRPGGAQLLWAAWLLAILGCGLIPGSAENPWRYALPAWFLITISGLLPDDGRSVLPYCSIIMIPLSVFKSASFGGMWTFLIFVIIFSTAPLTDLIVGVDVGNHTPEEQKELHGSFRFQLVTLLVAPAALASLIYGAWLTSSDTMTDLEFLGVSMSVGAMLGVIGITAGHELCHRATQLERVFGRFLLCTVCYGHFYVEHTVGHHKHVATDEDPATARYGENFYAFLPRVIVGEFRSACRIEAERMRRKGLPFWRCEIPAYLMCSAVLCGGLALAFGSTAVSFFVIQSAVAITLFESVNYLEHYGLERQEVKPGVYERVQPKHSWDSLARFTNLLLFKLQRHADHHAHAGKRYQTLQACESAPQLPSGYGTMIVLALIPPLWRAVMHPRVLAFRRLQEGQRFRHGPSPGLALSVGVPRADSGLTPKN